MKARLAQMGVILSGGTVQEIARIHGEYINAAVQAKVDALLDAHELYGVEPDTPILEEASSLRTAMIQEASVPSVSGLPLGVPASSLFLPLLEEATHAIIDQVACQIERRRVSPKFTTSKASPSSPDRRYAELAIEEALKSVPEDERVHPFVGAVVVKNGEVISKAHRGENLKSHAEFIALEDKLSDELVSGATVYTTLEPCTTRKHPKIACAQRLADRKVARVVIGMLDPNPEIRGLGDQLLNDAGIEVQLFPKDLRARVEEMNRAFIREQKGRRVGRLNGGAGEHSVPDLKLEALLAWKGKLVTVLNRQKYGHSYLESYWGGGATIIECNGLWVELEDPASRTRQSFSLGAVTVRFDSPNNRLQLDLER